MRTTNMQEHYKILCKDKITAIIEHKYASIIKEKSKGEDYLSYSDIKSITLTLKNYFRTSIGVVPKQIDVSCSFAEAILAPTITEKKKIIKNILSLSGGLAGVSLIIAGIGGILGWGTGVIASVTTFFVGSNFIGPIGLITSGVGIATIAGYLCLKTSHHKNSEKALKALQNGIANAIDTIWIEHGERIVDYEKGRTKETSQKTSKIKFEHEEKPVFQ